MVQVPALFPVCGACLLHNSIPPAAMIQEPPMLSCTTRCGERPAPLTCAAHCEQAFARPGGGTRRVKEQTKCKATPLMQHSPGHGCPVPRPVDDKLLTGTSFQRACGHNLHEYRLVADDTGGTLDLDRNATCRDEAIADDTNCGLTSRSESVFSDGSLADRISGRPPTKADPLDRLLNDIPPGNPAAGSTHDLAGKGPR